MAFATKTEVKSSREEATRGGFKFQQALVKKNTFLIFTLISSSYQTPPPPPPPFWCCFHAWHLIRSILGVTALSLLSFCSVAPSLHMKELIWDASHRSIFGVSGNLVGDNEVGMLSVTAADKQSCLVLESVRDQSQVCVDPQGQSGRSAGKSEWNTWTRIKTSVGIRRGRQRRDLARRKDTHSLGV